MNSARKLMGDLSHKIFVPLSANLRVQAILQQGVDQLQFLMGIGAGGSPDASGEAALVKLLFEEASPSGSYCVFDVGANTGGFLDMLTSSLGGRKAVVHAFEPGQAAFERLEENFGKNSHIKLNRCGFGATEGELTLYYSEPGSALASLTKRRLDHFRRKSPQPANEFSENVRIQTLDAYCAAEGIGKIDWLKIDVEGHELDVLTGAKGMLAAGKIRLVSFEFGGCNIDTRVFFQDYWYFFKEFPNARIFRLTPSGYLSPITKYLETLEQFRASNFLVKFAGR